MFEEIEYVTRSPARREILRALDGAGRVSGRDLRDSVDITRTTLTRTLDRLQEFGWVTAHPDGYELTLLGRYVLSVCDEFVARMETAKELAPVLSAVPADAFGFDPLRLDDATVTTAADVAPDAAERRLRELRTSASQLRELSSLISLTGVERLREQVRETAFPGGVEVVLEKPFVAHVRDDAEYAAVMADIADEDGVAMYAYPDRIPCTLTIVDDAVAIGVTNETGQLCALVETSEASVMTWARDTFREFRGAADRIERADLGATSGPDGADSGQSVDP